MTIQTKGGAEVNDRGEEVEVCLYYPRNTGQAKFVVIDLCDVRAADGVRLSYDFDRDGWKVEQAQVFEWESSDDKCDPEWKEVAFVQAWGSDKRNTDPVKTAPEWLEKAADEAAKAGRIRFSDGAYSEDLE